MSAAGVPSFKPTIVPLNRRQPPSIGQNSLNGSVSRNAPLGKPAPAATTPSMEEAFSLVTGGYSSAFSMIVKLTPSLLEEMKRVEAEGGKARIKFDSNPDTSNGNIIEVGGKEFKFIWSREFGDLCDVYEERQGGEEGKGLLVESGCAWRKLNIQRILDESTKSHVKMMSEEAKRKKQERRIVFESGKPSLKNLSAVEAASGNNQNKKKEAAPKNRNVEIFQAGGSSKPSTRNPGLSSRTSFMGKHSSPLTFTASSSPLGAVNISKSSGDALPSQMIGKPDGNAVYEKGTPALTFNELGDTPGVNGNDIAKPVDLRNMLISLLKSKPQGLALKALEKAVQGIVPNPLEKIRPILRNIARFKAPGRYFLLPGVDVESLNKPQTEIERYLLFSQGSPNGNHSQKPAHQELCDCPAPLGGFKDRVSSGDLEEPVPSTPREELNGLAPFVFGRGNGFDHSRGQGGITTTYGESGSDNEGDRTGNGAATGSHSSSGSGSESDASFNITEGFDKDAAIMSRDEEEPRHETEASSAEQVAEVAPTTATLSNIGGKGAENMPFSFGCDGSRHGQSGSSAMLSRGKPKKYAKTKKVGNIAEQRLGAEQMGRAQGHHGMNALVCESTRDEALLANKFERQVTFKHPESGANTSGNGKQKAIDAETEYPNQAQGGTTASYPVEERGQAHSSLGAGADKGKAPIAADESNRDQNEGASSADDSRYFKYEKARPEFKEPIKTPAQYDAYVKEYEATYPDYNALLQNVDCFRCSIQKMCDDLEVAKKNRDFATCSEILEKIRESNEREVLHPKRLKKIFVVLHQEMEHLKKLIEAWVDLQNRKNAQDRRNARNKRRILFRLGLKLLFKRMFCLFESRNQFMCLVN